MRDGGLEAALTELGVPLPPFSAWHCSEVLLKLDWLASAKFPISMRKRLETISAVREAIDRIDAVLLFGFVLPHLLIAEWALSC